MQEILDEAIKDYKKKEFFDNLNNGYAKLKADHKTWAEIEKEREAWDITLKDGLEE